MVEKPKPIKHKFSFYNPNILKSELLQFIRINPNDGYDRLMHMHKNGLKKHTAK